MMINTLARLDHQTGKVQAWWSGKTSTLQEPCFIAKPGSQREGEGYLIAIDNRLAASLSDLLIFDAERLEYVPQTTTKHNNHQHQNQHNNKTPTQQLPTTTAKVA